MEILIFLINLFQVVKSISEIQQRNYLIICSDFLELETFKDGSKSTLVNDSSADKKYSTFQIEYTENENSKIYFKREKKFMTSIKIQDKNGVCKIHGYDMNGQEQFADIHNFEELTFTIHHSSFTEISISFPGFESYSILVIENQDGDLNISNSKGKKIAYTLKNLIPGPNKTTKTAFTFPARSIPLLKLEKDGRIILEVEQNDFLSIDFDFDSLFGLYFTNEHPNDKSYLTAE